MCKFINCLLQLSVITLSKKKTFTTHLRTFSSKLSCSFHCGDPHSLARFAKRHSVLLLMHSKLVRQSTVSALYVTNEQILCSIVCIISWDKSSSDSLGFPFKAL